MPEFHRFYSLRIFIKLLISRSIIWKSHFQFDNLIFPETSNKLATNLPITGQFRDKLKRQRSGPEFYRQVHKPVTVLFWWLQCKYLVAKFWSTSRQTRTKINSRQHQSPTSI